MKNILLLVHDDAGQEARFQTALDITRALEGHLTCLDVAQVQVIAGDYSGGAATAMLMADEREREAANRVTLEARLAHEGVPWDWIESSGGLAECVTRAAGLADLIVVNRKLDVFPEPDMRGVTASIAVRSGTPVVAVPDNVRSLDVTGRALIAWDGSDPVMATMRACVPLLKLAEAIQLLTIDDGGEGVPAEEAAAYLSRHDIHATIRRVAGKHRHADDIIAEECAASEARYCLMGAFSHNRLVEALFGGVTRRMLSTSKLPLILGH
ncbi:universal stress protein [Sphingobium sp. H39-3-25]|uniref:universal stress protein n=1 Tax=Sphingobium arseniciresistens TaxID=3030834 RepID=UPI0023BA0757|nr:universal stress protein [Sphingobium arseniciresistens]